MSAVLAGVDKRFHSRKFQLAAACFLFSILWFSLGKFTSTEWIEYTRWVLGLYLLGNVGDTAAESLKR